MVLLVSELNTNQSNFNFPFLRLVDPNDLRGWNFVFVEGGTGGVKSDKIGNVFLKKLGSGMGLRSSR